MIVILTALDLEHAAVREHLADVRPHHQAAGTVFDVGRLARRPGCRVALASIGMGNSAAATITERAITEFRPAAVLFVGIAGGLRDWIGLGDVVVATRVYAPHGGRQDGDEFLARPRAWDTSHRLEQLARLVARRGGWGADVAVHFDPVAAGEVVLNSTTSPLNEQLRLHYNDAVAVEMESAGVAQAGHLNDATPTITVRGICDRADGRKADADAAGLQPLAARHAAAFAAALVAEHDDTAGGPAADRVADRPGGGRHEPTYHNSATDQANVGAQVGVVNGNVTFGAAPSRPGTGEDR
ncbi:5'-methylthioadenosine/S-adenosylhomocysteine nucleosidase [Saccharothrix sp. BKS2]|uniref:5'-methylthioadenosine/S-adenosylhomocysteine nucleosidase family protein n=1 Tax=Saccharothrix sp. BKS2 TaxID=3064400 RepID=UPI0039EA9BF7